MNNTRNTMKFRPAAIVLLALLALVVGFWALRSAVPDPGEETLEHELGRHPELLAPRDSAPLLPPAPVLSDASAK